MGTSGFDSFSYPRTSVRWPFATAVPLRSAGAGPKRHGMRADSGANPRAACRCLGTVSIIRQHRVHLHRSFSTQRNATDDAWIVRESGDAARHDFGRGFSSVFGGGGFGGRDY